MTHQEARKQRREHEGSDVCERRNAQDAVHFARSAAERGRRVTQRRDVRRCRVCEHAPRLREYRPLRHSTDQGDAQLILETTNRSTHGRLGNAKLLRRGGQRARLRDLDQHAELFKARFLEPFANPGHLAWLHLCNRW